jgi:hypothetical protein
LTSGRREADEGTEAAGFAILLGNLTAVINGNKPAEAYFQSGQVVALIFVLAGTVKGVTGMGLPTVSMGRLGAFMPPVTAAALRAQYPWPLMIGAVRVRVPRGADLSPAARRF